MQSVVTFICLLQVGAICVQYSRDDAIHQANICVHLQEDISRIGMYAYTNYLQFNIDIRPVHSHQHYTFMASHCRR